MFTRTRLSFEKTLFSSLLYLFMLKIVTHLLFQEEKAVGERDADRTAAKKYVSSVIFAPSQQTFLTIHGYPEVLWVFTNFFRNFAVFRSGTEKMHSSFECLWDSFALVSFYAVNVIMNKLLFTISIGRHGLTKKPRFTGLPRYVCWVSDTKAKAKNHPRIFCGLVTVLTLASNRYSVLSFWSNVNYWPYCFVIAKCKTF